VGYTIRKEIGTRSPLGRNKRLGYALYYDGNPIYPKCRNWWPTKAEAQQVKKRSEEDSQSRRSSSKKKKSKTSSKKKPKDDYWDRVSKLI